MSSLLVPTVIETTGRGERAYDLYSRLLRERIIMVNGMIEENMAGLIVAQLLFLAAENSEREINLYISSHGGVVDAGLAIYDTMRHLNCPIATTCVGYAASFGTVLLMAGDKGLRRALPNARIHMHQPLIQGGLAGQATDIDIHAREILHTRDVLNGLFAHHTGQSVEKIKRDQDRDFYMSAQEAVEYGLIDEVMQLADKPC
ncbi:MAG TPA: ATP-dependent Clp protease proteolytic subunit [Ktedonobacteraceae bacterium]|jgi:ATP-dependent Clp protease protease subunit